MNQLTKTNNNNFTLETSIMEQILDASGYNFHVLTIKGQRYWIGKEISNAFGFMNRGGSMNMFRIMDEKDVHTIRLEKHNGLKEIKEIILQEVRVLNTRSSLWTESSIKFSRYLSLVREDTLQKYLTLYTRNPDAKEIGNIIYKVLASGQALVEVVEEEKNPVLDLLNTELESNEFGSKFNTWYKEKINKCSYFWRWDEKNQLYNWQKSLIGLRMTLGSRVLKVAGKNSAKNVLKKQGASSKLTKSNRTIARSFDPASSDQMLFLLDEFMIKVDAGIDEVLQEGSMTETEAILIALTQPKAILDKFVLEDDDNVYLLQAIRIMHKKGLADDNEKDFKQNHLTQKDREGLDEGVLSIDMKPDLGLKLLEKSIMKLMSVDDQRKRKKR